MMDFMRRFASTWFGRALGVLLLIGLAGFGISNVITDLGSNTLTKVGDQEITIQDFQRNYQNQLNRVAQQMGQMPTDAQAQQMGIPATVLFQLAGNASLDQFGRQMGMGVSDAKLGALTRENPSFFGPLGKYDYSVLQQVLQQEGLTEAQYADSARKEAVRRQLLIALFDQMPVPKAGEDILNRYRNDTRTVEYFTLDATGLPDLPAPTDDQLKKYLADHQTTFRTKETRTIDVVAMTPEVLATQPEYQPTEDEIKAEYERTKDQLSSPEKRDIQQVVLSDPSKEQFFTAGTSFADAVKAAGLTATDFGLLSKPEVQDAALADAAFGLAKEGDFTIIAGIGAKRVIGVTKIEPAGVVAYDDAKADITKRLAVAKAKNAYADVQDQVEELRAAFKPLKEIADRFKLPIATVALTADGSELSSYPQIADADRAKVSQAVFAATAGKLAPTVAITATNNVWFDLSKVDEARDQTFDEVKDAVTKAWTDEQTAAALKDLVKSITDELDAGKTFQDVAAEHNQFATISSPITRDGDKTSVLNETVAEQIFSGGPDSHGSAVDADGAYVIYHVTDSTPATTSPDDAKIADFLRQSIAASVSADFVGGIRDALWPVGAREGAYGRMLQQLTLSTQ